MWACDESPEAALIPGVQKIAVLRANAIGDFVFSLPALESLRRAYPAAEIVLLGQAWHHGFLRGRPGPVDRVVVVPAVRGLTETPTNPERTAQTEAFFAAMAAERFDLAVQLHGGGRYSNPFVRKLEARVTAGLRTPDAEPLDRWMPYVYYQHEVLRQLEVASLVGARPAAIEPRLQTTPRDIEESLAAVPDDGRPIAVLNPGAGDPRRRWPAERFGPVGDALADAGMRVVITGIERERRAAEAAAGALSAPADNLCGRLSLEGLAGLLARARIMVSNDSGPLHLAGALGTPTVGLYWYPNMINSGLACRRRHRPLVSMLRDCPDCGCDCIRSRCAHDSSLLGDIGADEVIAAALDLLTTTEPAAAPACLE